MRTALLAAIVLATPGCTLTSFNALGARERPVRIVEVSGARIELTPALTLVYSSGAAVRTETFSLEPDRAWPLGPLPHLELPVVAGTAPTAEPTLVVTGHSVSLCADGRWVALSGALHPFAPVDEVLSARLDLTPTLVYEHREDDRDEPVHERLLLDDWPRLGDAELEHTDRSIVLVTEGRRREVLRVHRARRVAAPLPWLLLPVTLAIDAATLPISLPLTLFGLTFHT